MCAPPARKTPVNSPHSVGNIRCVGRHRQSSFSPLGERLTLASSVSPSHAGLPKRHGLETRGLLREMISSGVKARIVCVDPKKMPGEFAGRDLDEAFLRELPAGIDPCGENGEFHTCVYDGPMFREAIPIESGEVVEREGFVFADVRLIT